MTFVLFFFKFFFKVCLVFVFSFFLPKHGSLPPFCPTHKHGHEHMRGAGRVWLPEDLNAKLCFLWLS